ncbi:transmembrane protein [Elysia marginata]|uniref:Transmembrane protein n=1 Tax=Elysia marginata TaxID=1093978 RepID=A0AAV4IBK7_9GAST|nr:transmembrane protein [Elysia marginata]
MGYIAVVRAIAVRLLFAAHGVISIWRLALITDDLRFWYLGLVLCLLLVEMTITLGKKAGQEWKWFCPSVFIYLLCIVPTIWFMELHELENRIRERLTATTTVTPDSSAGTATGYNISNGSTNSSSVIAINNSSTTSTSCPCGSGGGSRGPANSYGSTERKPNMTIKAILGLEFEIKVDLDSDEWIRTLEQILLLILILGRWFLPKGKLTHDQLSQLLLVYIGTAADIVEFFEAFKEERVRYDRILCTVILGIWSLSLIQFSLVLTASRARRDRTGLVPVPHSKSVADTCCNPDVYGILISICLQDLPFLVLRLLLIFKYNVVSYTNMFFTCKNTIVIILLIYRLIVVHMERRRLAKQEKEETASAARISMLIQGRSYHASTPALFEPGVRRGIGTGYINGGHVLKVTGYGSGQQFLGGVGGGSQTTSEGGRGFVIGEGGTIGRGGGLIGADRETGGYRGVSSLSLSKPNGDSFLRVTPLSSPRQPEDNGIPGQPRGCKVGSAGQKQCSNNNYDVRANTTTRTYKNNSYSSINADDRNSPV